MTPELIARIVGLVRRQGERVVLADSVTGKAVVIMDLEQYEALTSVSEEGGGLPVQQQVPQIEVGDPEPKAPNLAPPDLGIPAFRAPISPPQIEPHVEAPPAPPITHKSAPEKSQKISQQSDNPFRKRAEQLGVQPPLDPMDLTDLTQTELLDKINRDIGDWKTAQERKRSDELQSVAKRPKSFADDRGPAPVVAEEERFYLEPIE
jgi:hypothetical protein